MLCPTVLYSVDLGSKFSRTLARCWLNFLTKESVFEYFNIIKRIRDLTKDLFLMYILLHRLILKHKRHNFLEA